MSDLSYLYALVVGAGSTGRAAARFLARRGARVRVVDRSPEATRDPAWPDSVELRAGGDEPGALEGIDMVVPSPGVARDHPLLTRAVDAGLPVWSEIELAYRYLGCPVLAVTGTNGKSTTTTLLGNMLRQVNPRVFVGGNLGTPLIEACDRPFDAAVVEVSSFQLEWVERFRARVAVILNITPDHQDRYRDLDEYAETKARLLDGQQEDDVAVLNRDDPRVWKLHERARGSVVSFGRRDIEEGTYLDRDEVVVRCAGGAERYALRESPLTGEHNRENIQAAATAAAVWGVESAAIRKALHESRGLPHRLEFVRELRGVRWYDDSKGTNTGAVEKSLASFPGGVVLLLGGHDKGGDFTILAPLLRRHAARVIFFGKAGAQIESQLAGVVPSQRVPKLADAVAAAAAVATSGQVVLLSPGCASFDEFRDYNERGEKFRAWVEALS